MKITRPYFRKLPMRDQVRMLPHHVGSDYNLQSKGALKSNHSPYSSKMGVKNTLAATTSTEKFPEKDKYNGKDSTITKSTIIMC